MFRVLIWIILAPIVAFMLFNVFALGSIISWRAIAPESTAFMRYQLPMLQQKDPELVRQYQWVPYDKISVNLKKALIASEDAKFTAHDGFDWKGIQVAIEKNERKGKITAGGSTISQQLSKNLFLWEGRDYIRKGEETILTSMLEANMSKKRIFEIYLNVIEWGNGVYGAQAASQYYYGVNASELSPFQAARLASMVTNPRYYDDNPKDRKLARKTNIILKRLGSAQIPEDEQDKSMSEQVPKAGKTKKKRKKSK